MQRSIVEHPTESDVLFGRHAESRNHEGNKRFREIVTHYQDEYHSKSNSRMEKVAIVARIVEEVRENGARFLKFDSRIGNWFEVDRKACIDKVGHSIRDKQSIVNRSSQFVKEHQARSLLKDKSTRSYQDKEEPAVDHECTRGISTAESESRRSSISFGETPECSLSEQEATEASVTSTIGRPKLSTPSSLLIAKQALVTGPLSEGEAASRILAYSQRRKMAEAAAARKLLFAEEILTAVQEQSRLQGELDFLRQKRPAFLPAFAKLPFPHLKYLPQISESATLRRSLLSPELGGPFLNAGNELLGSKLADALYLARMGL